MTSAGVTPEREVRQRAEAEPDTVKRPADPAVMFGEIPQPTLHQDRKHRVFRCGRTADMRARCLRVEHDRIAGIPNPPAQIHILGKEEKSLVPAVELLEKRSPDEDTRSRHPFRAPTLAVTARVAYQLVRP